MGVYCKYVKFPFKRYPCYVTNLFIWHKRENRIMHHR